jgi:signal transduction histidine kinase
MSGRSPVGVGGSPGQGPRRTMSQVSVDDAADPAPTEVALAGARALLAVLALVSFARHPPLYDAWTVGLHVFLAVYAAHAIGLGLWLARRRGVAPRLPRTLHGLDMLWAVAAALGTAGLPGPGLACLALAALGAAYRWGLRAAALTAAATLGLVFAGALAAGPRPTLGSRAVLVMDGIALLPIVGLAGYLVESEKRRRERAGVLASALECAQSEAGFARALTAALRRLIEAYEATGALLVTHEAASGRAFLWDVSPEESPSPMRSRPTELDPARRHLYFFETPARSWRLEREEGHPPFTMVGLDGDGQRLAHPVLPTASFQALFERHRFASLLGVSAEVAGEWEGRLFLLDPKRNGGGADDLRFFHDLAGRLAATLFSKYVVGRLRSRVGAMERARVARELHDGTIQSLVGIEMEMDVLRRQTERLGLPMTGELGRIQRLLRNEVHELRETLLRLKPPDIGPAHLVGFLDDTVARFERDTGIQARFDCDLEDVDLPPQVCREIGRIAQEALHNVRKHSGARNVVVRFEHEGRGFSLVVDDDGRGFPFGGRLSHAELEQGRLGPLTIKERVRALGAELSIDSAPGRGSRLEVLLSRERP